MISDIGFRETYIQGVTEKTTPLDFCVFGLIGLEPVQLKPLTEDDGN